MSAKIGRHYSVMSNPGNYAVAGIYIVDFVLRQNIAR
jgi:hypothetical protein